MRPSVKFAAAAVLTLSTLSASTTASAVGSVDQLLDAPVPSMCTHPAGQLVNGELPGLEFGDVMLDTEQTVLADITGGPGREAVAVFHCNAGGVGWPDVIVFYGASGRILATRDLGAVFGDRAGVTKVSVSGRRVTIRAVGIVRDGDYSCCGSGDGILTVRWNRDGTRNSTKKVITERASITRLFAAVEAGNRTRALRFASTDVVDTLVAIEASGGTFELDSCTGPLTNGSPTYERVCLSFITSSYRYPADLNMVHTGFGRWKVESMAQYFGERSN